MHDDIVEDGNFPYITSRRKRGRQKNHHKRIRSVEGTLRNCLIKLYGNIEPESLLISSCSRTDKGVHARRMVVAFSTSQAKVLPFNGDLKKLVYVLNRMLPFDVRIENASPFPLEQFHPSLDTKSKTYVYTFSVGNHPDPLRWRHEYQIEDLHGQAFDVNKARNVIRLFKGTHNFNAFRGAFRGNERGKYKDPICTIFDISITSSIKSKLNLTTPPIEDKLVGGQECSNTYCLTVKGDRFLYKMVRFLAGVAISAGFGKVSAADIKAALENGERETSFAKHKVICAPANGLMLSNVEYDENVKFAWVK